MAVCAGIEDDASAATCVYMRVYMLRMPEPRCVPECAESESGIVTERHAC